MVVIDSTPYLKAVLYYGQSYRVWVEVDHFLSERVPSAIQNNWTDGG